jgi:hypothetical protein
MKAGLIFFLDSAPDIHFLYPDGSRGSSFSHVLKQISRIAHL